jgi:hypothetical protein
MLAGKRGSGHEKLPSCVVFGIPAPRTAEEGDCFGDFAETSSTYQPAQPARARRRAKLPPKTEQERTRGKTGTRTHGRFNSRKSGIPAPVPAQAGKHAEEEPPRSSLRRLRGNSFLSPVMAGLLSRPSTSFLFRPQGVDASEVGLARLPPRPCASRIDPTCVQVRA